MSNRAMFAAPAPYKEHVVRNNATTLREIRKLQESCSHASQRGTRYKSRFCPLCSIELYRPSGLVK